ncbi:MAG TPA: hypothetical protein PLR31_11560 [Anaerohalosphaeraceae bacterium]|nr:hypothetical protein [Anaerohalosphaeraceae bacterium]
MMEYIGLSGKSGAGKTTLAVALRDAYQPERAVVWGFGHEVKIEFILQYPDLAYSVEDLDSQHIKNIRLSKTQTIRDALIRIGLERRRKDPDYWLRRWLKRTKQMQQCGIHRVIAPDVRFENEAQAIERLGGLLVRLTRNPVYIESDSDTLLDYYPFRYIIDNACLTIDQSFDVLLKLVNRYFGGQI